MAQTQTPKSTLDANDVLTSEVSSVSEELGSAVSRAQSFTGAGGAMVARVDGDELVCMASCGANTLRSGTRIPVGGSLAGLMARGEALKCDDSDSDPRGDIAVCIATRCKSFIVVPVQDKQSPTTGIVAVFSPSANGFSQLHIAILKTMSVSVAPGLARARSAASAPVAPKPARPAAPPPLPAVAAAPIPELKKPEIPTQPVAPVTSPVITSEARSDGKPPAAVVKPEAVEVKQSDTAEIAPAALQVAKADAVAEPPKPEIKAFVAPEMPVKPVAITPEPAKPVERRAAVEAAPAPAVIKPAVQEKKEETVVTATKPAPAPPAQPLKQDIVSAPATLSLGPIPISTKKQEPAPAATGAPSKPVAPPVKEPAPEKAAQPIVLTPAAEVKPAVKIQPPAPPKPQAPEVQPVAAPIAAAPAKVLTSPRAAKLELVAKTPFDTAIARSTQKPVSSTSNVAKFAISAGIAALVLIGAGVWMFHGTPKTSAATAKPQVVAAQSITPPAAEVAQNPPQVAPNVSTPPAAATMVKPTATTQPATAAPAQLKPMAAATAAAAQPAPVATTPAPIVPAAENVQVKQPSQTPRQPVAEQIEAPKLVASAGAMPEINKLLPGTTAPVLAAAKVSDVVPSQLLQKVAPYYPETAKRMRVEGTVVLSAKIDRQGKVADVKVISGNSMLRDAAINAVKQWKYKPATLNGAPIESTTDITLKFTAQ